MVTAEEVKDEALSLAKAGLSPGEAMSLLGARVDRRVPLVMAKRLLEASLDEDPDDRMAAEALGFVKGVLEGGDWAE